VIHVFQKKLRKNAESLHLSNTCKIQTKNNDVALQTCNSQLNITLRGVNNDDKATAVAAGVHTAAAAGVHTAVAAVHTAGVHTAAARP
jgi:hypothetical protein